MTSQQLFEFDHSEPAPTRNGTGLAPTDLNALQSKSVLNSVPPRILKVETPSDSVVKGLRNRLELGASVAAHVIARVLAARGITSAYQKREQLDGSLTDLPDPSCALNFDRATEIILRAIESRARFGVVGDYDVDGITAVAQWNQTALEAGVDSHYWIPNRFTDGYGTSPRIAQEMIAAGVQIAIFFDHTPLPSIVADLRVKGIECLVFDHHSLTADIDAIVVNPRQSGCGLAPHAPSASGLSFLLCTRLREQLYLPAPSTALVAAGTVADMVPLDRRTNRILVKRGLSEITQGANIGLHQLMRRIGRSTSDASCDTIAFTIAPRINAAGRMDDARRCVDLLTTPNAEEAFALAGELEQYNEARQVIQAQLVRACHRRIQLLEVVPPVIVLMDEAHHSGVNGLVAQSVASKWARPAVILSRHNNDSETLVGSARNGNRLYDLTELWAHVICNSPPGMVLKAGGHPAAAGIAIRAEFLGEFEKALCGAFRNLYGAPLPQVTVAADFELTLQQLTARLINTIDQHLAPYGQGFSAPRFLFRDLTVASISEWRSELGYSVMLEQGKSRVLGLIGLPEYEADLRSGACVDVIASATTELYRGEYRPQLSILGYKVISPASESSPDKRRQSLLFEVPLDESASPNAAPRETPPAQTRVREARKPRESTRPSNTERLQLLMQRLEAVRRDFDHRWLYPDLAKQEADPFAPKGREFYEQLWADATKELGLALQTQQLDYRPAAIEFVRFVMQRGGNHILCAPTGSGKTAIALTLGSIFFAQGRRLVFLAPTVEIVRQTAVAAERLLGSPVTVLDGQATDTAMRRTIHRDKQPKIICATPHVLKNDLTAGVFSFTERDLLMDDEAHHEEGAYPSVAVVDAARQANASILLLSATPGQVEAEGHWSKLQTLKQRVGVDCVFPLNVRASFPEIDSQHTPPTPEMQAAHSQLLVALGRLRDQVLAFFEDQGLRELHRDTTQLFGGRSVTLPPRNVINALLERVRAISHENRWEIHSKLQAAAELRDLCDVLTHQGTAMFLIRCIERRFEVYLPKKKLGKSEWLAAPQHLRMVYHDANVSKAYLALAKGKAIHYVNEGDFKACIGDKAARWKKLTQRERTALFNQTVRATKAQVLLDLATHEYCNHPHEDFLVREIKRHQRKTLISVPTRDYAFFLTERLQHRLDHAGTRVVAITGTAQGTRKGTSPKQRQENLAAFNSGDARIAVATQVIDEGVDLRKVEQGYIIGFDGSQRRARQRQGRVGRHSFGRVTYLCASQRDYIKLYQILKKEISFEEMLNKERATILQKAGISPATSLRKESFETNAPGPPRFNPEDPPPF